MQIDKDFGIIVAFVVAYLANNTNDTEVLAKLKPITLKYDLVGIMENDYNMTDVEFADYLEVTVASLQDKIAAYEDLEY